MSDCFNCAHTLSGIGLVARAGALLGMCSWGEGVTGGGGGGGGKTQGGGLLIL